MNIELTEREKQMLSIFAEKQCEGAKDNIGTVTPIHVVERVRTEYVDTPNGDTWIWTNDYEYKAFDNFDDMVAYIREQTKEDYPEYGDIEYKDVTKNGEEIWIESEEAYCHAFGIEAFRAIAVQYTEPVAFFFIRDEAVKYMTDYQKHNCRNCRIYTYGLGYSNKGDLPVFRALLMRMGESINADNEAKETVEA